MRSKYSMNAALPPATIGCAEYRANVAPDAPQVGTGWTSVVERDDG